MDSAPRAQTAVVLSVLAVVCPCAFGLNPSLDINQFAHKAWPIQEGLFKSAIRSIAQTPDGYLWMGTEFGLLRFDGVRPVPWSPPAPERLPSSSIYTLLAARDGTLWIGTEAGLASWNGSTLNHYPQLDRYRVTAFFQDGEGTIWVGGGGFGGPTGLLCATRGGSMQCYGEDGTFGRSVLSIHEVGDDLWISAENGIRRWKPGDSKLYPMPGVGRDYREGLNDVNGHLLISTHSGLRELVDGKIKQYTIPAPRQQLQFTQLLRDRDGVLWIGTSNHGVSRVHQARTDVFSRFEGLSSDSVVSLFEDREGNVWVATTGGLDRFREFAVSTISASQGLSTDDAWSVLAARDGSVWAGTRSGLNNWRNGRITIFRRANGLPDDEPQSLFGDNVGRIWLFTNHGLGYLQDGTFILASGVPGGQVHAISVDSAGDLWLSEDRSLLRIVAGRVVEEIPWSRLGAKEDAWILLAADEPGGLWLGFERGPGVIYLKDGQIRQSYRAENGLGEGSVAGLKLDRDGALWAATAGGLSVIKNGHVSTLTTKNGLPCDTAHWVMDDDDRSTWLYLACGVARIDRTELDAWKADPKRAVHPTVFDTSDGIPARSTPSSGYSPRVTKSQDGRLWFLAGTGVSVIDPRHLPLNKLLPPVHVEEIIADDKTRWTNSSGTAATNLRLPALTRRLEIQYTALSLVAPEKVRFKYKLEGYDADWEDAGNGRKAVYTSLSPHRYRFRVMASNNSGVWNEAGDTLEFSIAPAFYQTNWFRALMAAVVLAMLWGLYRLRLYQIAREFSAKLDGRVDERLRVARELHDTLLQSFHGLLFRMQAADNMLPLRPEQAGQTLKGAISRAEQAIAEGRNAIQNLRSEAAQDTDIAESLRAVGQELASQQESGNPATFGVTVEGERQPLSPILQDEVYGIAREILRNGFKHASARQIEVEIRYDPRGFRLRIRDDGKGIDPRVLKQGKRAGHWGLPGIQERAKQIGARLDLWSEVGAGTEIEVIVPASLAYLKSGSVRAFPLFRKRGTHAR